ncbi:MAG: hypothetical protein ABJH04_07360 [Cyclobacteriaceae bacterium]
MNPRFPLESLPYINGKKSILLMIDQYSNVVLLIVAAGFTLHLFMTIWRIFFEERFSWRPFIMVFVMLVFINNYSTVIDDFDAGINDLVYSLMFFDRSGTYAEHNSNTVKVEDTALNGNGGPPKSGQASKGMETNIWKILFVNGPLASLEAVGGMFSGMLSGILSFLAKSFVSVFSVSLSLALIAFGILALAISFIPSFEGVFRGWIAMFLTVKFWFVTLTIVDLVASGVTTSFTSSLIQSGKSINDSLLVYLIQFINAVLYIIVPFLTTIYLPSQGGQFLSLTTGALTMVTKTAMAAATKGASLIK